LGARSATMSAVAKEHLEIKGALVGALHDTAALAGEVGMSSLAKELTAARIPKIDEERFALVVLGEFNHGKSTFVNALCDAAILPAGITPTTATINHLVWAEAPRAVAWLTDGTEKPIDPQALADWVTIEGKQVEHVRYVEIGWPAEILKDRVTLVDTPGVNDINEQRAEITYSYIPRADAALFLLDGAQVLKQSERAFLEQRILRRSKDKLIFVLGKIDLLAPDEREEALRYCREHLARVVAEPVLFAVSAKRALSSKPEERAASGLAPLRDYLGQYLANERGRVLLDNGIADGLRTLGYLRQNLGIKRRSLGLALDELEQRIARVRAQLDGTQAHLRAHHAKIRAEAEAIKAGMRLDLEGFVAEILARIPDEIERADGDAIKRFLQPFIQDTWKAWAEQEGEKIAAQLERLAEEIIQVTNENVNDAMATLARELGPADARIDLEVDTLKYDVGVFALGALGTGIFLFVNTLVGGLLTLAAPILAVVLKERVAGEVKAQAKKNLPEVTKKAAETVGPRFEQIIEDFQGRLADFVTAAGDALHRGISEVLDRALAERRAQGVDTEARVQEIEAQQVRLTDIERRLAGLRDKLWASSTDSTDSPISSAT
jgi:small GTP-binding protein